MGEETGSDVEKVGEAFFFALQNDLLVKAGKGKGVFFSR